MDRLAHSHLAPEARELVLKVCGTVLRHNHISEKQLEASLRESPLFVFMHALHWTVILCIGDAYTQLLSPPPAKG